MNIRRMCSYTNAAATTAAANLQHEPRKSKMPETTDSRNDIELLNASLGGEYFGIAAYQAAIGSGLLEDGVRDVAEKFQGDHKQQPTAFRRRSSISAGIPSRPRPGINMPRSFPRQRSTIRPTCFDTPPPLRKAAPALRLRRSGSIRLRI